LNLNEFSMGIHHTLSMNWSCRCKLSIIYRREQTEYRISRSGLMFTIIAWSEYCQEDYWVFRWREQCEVTWIRNNAKAEMVFGWSCPNVHRNMNTRARLCKLLHHHHFWFLNWCGNFREVDVVISGCFIVLYMIFRCGNPYIKLMASEYLYFSA